MDYFRQIILREWNQSETQEAPADSYPRENVTLLRKTDGSLYFLRNECQIRRFDDSLSREERAVIDRVWSIREKFYKFPLLYSPEYITRREVMSMMDEQNRIFLKSIETLVKGHPVINYTCYSINTSSCEQYCPRAEGRGGDRSCQTS